MAYAMSVIIGRALPDVRDGFKPANRRVLYGMRQMGLQPGRALQEERAKVVGEVMGKYHPHGGGAIYDTLVRLAQDLNLRVPLVDGQGNFGSVDGDNAAAMRYTEARLTRLGAAMMTDMEKDTVDFVADLRRQLHRAVGDAHRRSRTCSSTARRASRWAWPPRSRPTTWARWWRPCLFVIEQPGPHAGRAAGRRDGARARPGLPDRRASSTAGPASARPIARPRAA